MPHEPAFMADLERYHAEARAVRTEDEWRAFEARWFDRDRWPRRELIFAPMPDAWRETLTRDGRRWSRTAWTYDLTPEARHAYFAVALGVGLPIRYPELARAARGWLRCCSYCEISTPERAGEDACPVCGRELLWEHVED